MSLLEKALNYCPSSKDINNEELLDDIFSYCRNIRLKHHFDASKQNNNSTDSSVTELRSTEFDERCKMKSTYKNPYFYPSSKFTPPNLVKYLAATKVDIMKLAEKQSQTISNLTSSERETLNSLKKRTNIVITNADKGGNVVMNNEAYVKNCDGQFDNKESYVELNRDTTTNIVSEINSEIRSMLDKKPIGRKESQLHSEHLYIDQGCHCSMDQLYLDSILALRDCRNALIAS